MSGGERTLMERTAITVLGMAVALVFSFVPAQAGRTAIEGTWLTGNQSEITIQRCGQGFCGTLSKIMVPLKDYRANQNHIEKLGIENIPDIRNKDPQKRNRRLLGLRVLNLDTQSSNAEFSGTIYNPEDGNTYDGSLKVVSRDKLRLTGCIFFGKLCRSEDWVRVDRTVMPASCPSGQTRQFWLHCLGRD